MADKILATFRIEPEKWELFKALATSNGSTASAAFLQFVDSCLDANEIPSASSAHISPSRIEALIDKRIENSLAVSLTEVRSQLEELRGKSKAR
ncbi:hypothetical protein [uncultured Nostoc sp.]|uniref:hypothetical protein n=1 Tax=uncultured Nostoc sp. TaxID=340711 RepID=UPI0035CA5E0E